MAEALDLTVEYGDVRAEEQLDWPKLVAWLREHDLPGVDAQPEVKQFRGGSSNLTYLLRFGDCEWVVRRPPFGPLPVGGHDMAREFRVLSRIWEAFKPAPRAMLFSDDTSIIGAPFFVMERREGIVFKNRQPVPEELGDDPATFKAISEGFIDTLADLHAVDYGKVGLGGLGKPEGFVKRQITGWMERWHRAKTEEVPLMDRLGAWYLEHMPAPLKPVILHNDFYLHNIMLDRKNPGQINGVFDWEMSTLGDPMVDLGIALGYWRERVDVEVAKLSDIEPHTFKAGFQSRAEMLQRYAKRTGRDVSSFPFYLSWALWKNATVVQQIYVRYVRGQTSDPRFAQLGPHPPALALAAARYASQWGFHS